MKSNGCSLIDIWNEFQIFKQMSKKGKSCTYSRIMSYTNNSSWKTWSKYIQKEKGMEIMWYCITQTMRSKVREKWVLNCNMKFSKTSQKLRFGVTKKDPCLVFYFHVLNLFKYWSNLGLTDFEITIKIQKLSKNWKTDAHSLLMSYTNNSSWKNMVYIHSQE